MPLDSNLSNGRNHHRRRLTESEKSRLADAWPKVAPVAADFDRRYPGLTCGWTGVVAVAICEAIPTFGDEENHWDYLVNRAVNACKNEVRAAYAKRRRPAHGDPLPAAYSEATTGTEDIDRIHNLDAIEHAISALSPEEQEILRMRHLEGRSHREIASITGKTHAATHQAYRRTLLTLRAAQGRDD